MDENLKDVQEIIKRIEEKRPNFHKYIPIILFIFTTLSSLYIGGWLLAARSTIKFVVALMTGTVTVGLVCLTIFHIIMAVFVVFILFSAGAIVSQTVETLVNLLFKDNKDEESEV